MWWGGDRNGYIVSEETQNGDEEVDVENIIDEVVNVVSKTVKQVERTARRYRKI